MRFHFVYESCKYPSSGTPPWADRVDRWYQLDAAAFGLCELFHNQLSGRFEFPDLIVAASPDGSLATDQAFARGGACSPAKFVHTLPNIRISVVLQLMKSSAQVLCLQNASDTVESALLEACAFSKTSKVWILGTHANLNFACVFDPHGEFLIEPKDPMKHRKSKPQTQSSFSWLQGPGFDVPWISPSFHLLRSPL